ncbi:MAG: hypothetical protein Q9222_004410 [Ikaeria aurantiellina]
MTPLVGTETQSSHRSVLDSPIPDSELHDVLPKKCYDAAATAASWPKKTKTDYPMADMNRMTTVQEACLDSPTIPGRPPLLERSMSVPAVALHRLSEEPNQSTPRATLFPVSPRDSRDQIEPQSADFISKPAKRSSFLISRELTPLIIPPNGLEYQRKDTSSFLDIGEDCAVLPPRVPPKSPRSGRTTSPSVRKHQHSAQSSVSTHHSTSSNTSATSISSSISRASRIAGEPRRTGSPLSRWSPLSASERSPPDSIWSKLFRLDSPSRQTKAPENIEKRGSPGPPLSSISSPVVSPHQRWGSEASAVPRGRLVRKDSLTYRPPNKSTIRSPSSKKRSVDLPTGFKAAEAPSQVADVEIRSLRQQAGEQVSNFEVLQAKDVAMLSKELRQLDDRCEYLQRTYQSLRQGRRSLHARMISYLRSPHMTNYSRENILKQEEALADIDSSIDDWIRKSEQAENRRARIRQKLLEHVAAALTLQPTYTAGSRDHMEKHTPPASPEEDVVYAQSKHERVQSIKIYADAGVAALLAEIEAEIGTIAKSGKQMIRD